MLIPRFGGGVGRQMTTKRQILRDSDQSWVGYAYLGIAVFAFFLFPGGQTYLLNAAFLLLAVFAAWCFIAHDNRQSLWISEARLYWRSRSKHEDVCGSLPIADIRNVRLHRPIKQLVGGGFRPQVILVKTNGEIVTLPASLGLGAVNSDRLEDVLQALRYYNPVVQLSFENSPPLSQGSRRITLHPSRVPE